MDAQTNMDSQPFSFAGKGGEYFKIWIVNILLSIVTMGVYSAWAKVRTQRYFYGNTFLQGSSFEYHAKGLDILKGRILAFIALLIYTFSANASPVLGGIMAILWALLLPWAIWSSFRFNARVSSYRNVRFNFAGKVGKAYKILFFLPLIPMILGAAVGAGAYYVYEVGGEVLGMIGGLTMLAFYLFLPYIQAEFTQYYLNNLQYGQGDFSADVSARQYYKIYLSLVLWLLAALAVIAAASYFASQSLGGVQPIDPQDPSTFKGLIPFAMPVMAGLLFLSMAMKAFLKARIRNYAYSQLALDEVMELRSTLQARKLFFVYSGNFLLVMLTLGLAIPWAKVRLAKLSTESMTATTTGDLGEFINQQHARQSAIGDELGDAFDMPADLGLSL